MALSEMENSETHHCRFGICIGMVILTRESVVFAIVDIKMYEMRIKMKKIIKPIIAASSFALFLSFGNTASASEQEIQREDNLSIPYVVNLQNSIYENAPEIGLQTWVKGSTTRYETTKFYKVKADSSSYLYFVVRSDDHKIFVYDKNYLSVGTRLYENEMIVNNPDYNSWYYIEVRAKTNTTSSLPFEVFVGN